MTTMVAKGRTLNRSQKRRAWSSSTTAVVDHEEEGLPRPRRPVHRARPRRHHQSRIRAHQGRTCTPHCFAPSSPAHVGGAVSLFSSQVDAQRAQPVVFSKVWASCALFYFVCFDVSTSWWCWYVRRQSSWRSVLQGLPQGIVESSSDLELKSLWQSSSSDSRVISLYLFYGC